MYQPFHRLRVRFAEMELRQGDVAQAAGMAKSTMTARMKGYQPWTSDEITRVAAVLNIPREQIGEFFFEPSPKSKKGAFSAFLWAKKVCSSSRVKSVCSVNRWLMRRMP